MRVIDLTNESNTKNKWVPSISVKANATAYVSYHVFRNFSEFRLVETRDKLTTLLNMNNAGTSDEKWIRLTFSSGQLNSSNLALGGFIRVPNDNGNQNFTTYKFFEMISWVPYSSIRDIEEGDNFVWLVPIILHDDVSHHHAILELNVTAQQPPQYFCEEPNFAKAVKSVR